MTGMEAAPASEASENALNPWVSHSDGGVVFVRRLREDELDEAASITYEQLSASVAAKDVAKRVLRHNSESFWGVYRASNESGENARLVGYLSMLMLNAAGLAALKAGLFDAQTPSLDHLAGDGGPAEAIYLWSIIARKLGAISIAMVAKAMGSAYAGLTLYATAASDAGLRTIRGFGFKPEAEGKEGLGDLFRLDRSPGASGEAKPRRANPWNARFKTVVARSSDEVEKALAIRAAVFMLEQNCPYEEEFDGNDRTGSHIVGYVDGEPAATIRIRYFADFVKLERLAVLPRFRRTLIAKEVIESAVNFCRRKGYRTIYGHAQKRLVPFWSRFGFRPLAKNYRLVFSDHEYVEMWGQVDPHPNPLTVHSDPYVLVRPEGYWDEPGALDRSAARPVTSPH